MRSVSDFPVTFTINDVVSLQKENKYKGFFTLNEYRFQHRLFNGEMSPIISREIVERGDAVLLLAYDSKKDRVVMTEQIRIAAVERHSSPWMLEMIAGIIDTDETQEQVVRREAKEEAGLEVGRCEYLLHYFASSGGMNERLYVFVGEVDSDLAKGIHGLAEEGEDIRVHVIDREQAYQWVEEGKIVNAGSIIALQWLQLHYKTLQKKWGNSE